MATDKRYQVFISSTYEDLIAEREVVSLAILRSHNIPSGMELSSGANDRTLDVIYRWIADCDFFILLLAGRYGSVSAASGLSYVELEYNYAKAHDKPVIVLWITDEYLDRRIRAGSLEVKQAYERVHIAEWQRFRRRVTGDSFCIVISDISELEPKVIAAIDSVKMTHSLGGWIRTTAVLELVLDQYARYVNYYLDVLDEDVYSARKMEDLLKLLHEVLKSFFCAELGWLDVMIPVVPTKEDLPALLTREAKTESGVWLKVAFSGVRRTHRPTLIPTEVCGQAWRGSGNAFLSRGLDYVGTFRGLYSGADYDLPPAVADRMEKQYEYWRQEHYFSSLLAVAILPPDADSHTSLGVLNLNFKVENAIGATDVLPPDKSIAIMNVLEPALRLLATAIERQRTLERRVADEG